MTLPEIWATAWQNQQSDCAPSEDSYQPGHPPSLIRVFAVRMKKAWVFSYPLSAQRRLWSDLADAQADLSLRCAHSHFVGCVMSRLKFLNLSQDGILYFKYGRSGLLRLTLLLAYRGVIYPSDMEMFDNLVNKYEIEAYEKLSMKLHLPLNHSRSRKPRRHLVTTELGKLACNISILIWNCFPSLDAANHVIAVRECWSLLKYSVIILCCANLFTLLGTRGGMRDLWLWHTSSYYWAAAGQNHLNDLRAQRRLRSAWTSPSLIRVLIVRLKKPWVLGFQMNARRIKD